jgi:hypothetical protein
METLTVAIAGIVEGDLSFLGMVLTAGHRALLEAAANLPQLVVSRSGLARVLENLRNGFFSPEDIQRWASFVRRGYVTGGVSGELRPIGIEYDAKDEALIAEIIGRLDEIGDQVDGRIDASEVEEMLRAVRQ